MDSSTPFRLPRKTPFGIGENVAEWATGLSQLDKFYAQRPANADTKTFLRFTLDILGIDYRIAHGSLGSVPKQGATVIVANQYLKTVPELDQLFIGVDVFEGKDAVKSNMKALRAANKHLANGGLLLVFPAGEVSKLVDAKQQRLEDKEWSRSVSALIRKNKAVTVPVFIRGQNSKRFYMAGKIHPLLRTLMLGRELLNKSAKTIELSFGQAIKFKELNNLNDDQIVNYLRLNTYLLNRDVSATQQTVSDNDLLPIAAGLPIGQLLEELHSLPAETQLLQNGEFDVYCASAQQIPSLLHEIGRLREHNFRQVGEGTGQAIDIDHFDHDYLHLFVWDRENQCMVGAYRLGLVDQLLAKYGVEGLYSRTLFNYDQRFLDQMGKSIEMGRSVIAEPYQKSMSALLLLWKGIATFVHQHPEYTHLFGPVSISNDYSHTARQLLAQSMTLHHYDNDCAEYVTPSNPLPETNLNWNTSMLTALGDLQLLSRVIARIDEGKGVPVLLRQYLSLNGKLVCFNVDPAFNNALDGLIMVDLRDVPEKTLARYMGSENAREYLAMNN
ncbi:TPA: lysophospholipid acyltransferase family protein [Vibrio parahaemolyticus]|nr:lysophospholipid acyltransferase family protein [Vibrio parahaemolyticus]